MIHEPTGAFGPLGFDPHPLSGGKEAKMEMHKKVIRSLGVVAAAFLITALGAPAHPLYADGPYDCEAGEGACIGSGGANIGYVCSTGDCTTCYENFRHVCGDYGHQAEHYTLYTTRGRPRPTNETCGGCRRGGR